MNLFEQKATMLIRLSLGICFLWFGLLKVFDSSPVLSIMKHALPVLANAVWYVPTLGLVEVLIAAALLSHRFVKLAVIVLEIYLLISTVTVLFTQGFAPFPPVLSLPGEYAVKNVVLMAAGFILLAEHREKNVSKLKDEKKIYKDSQTSSK